MEIRVDYLIVDYSFVDANDFGLRSKTLEIGKYDTFAPACRIDYGRDKNVHIFFLKDDLLLRSAPKSSRAVAY